MHQNAFGGDRDPPDQLGELTGMDGEEGKGEGTGSLNVRTALAPVRAWNKVCKLYIN